MSNNKWVFQEAIETRSGRVIRGEELYQAFKARLMEELDVRDFQRQLREGLEALERARRHSESGGAG